MGRQQESIEVCSGNMGLCEVRNPGSASLGGLIRGLWADPAQHTSQSSPFNDMYLASRNAPMVHSLLTEA